MNTPPGLWLSTESLLSKHGFNDGDMPDDVWDALDAAGVQHREVDWHHLLRSFVRGVLLPASPHRIDVEDVSTSHNPIRAVKVDGRSVDAFLGPDQLGDAMRHVGVLVPMDQVVAAARQATTGLRLEAAELLNRYGFDDGRTPQGFYDWLEARDIPDPTRAEWNELLRHAVRDALLPLSRFAHIEVRDVRCRHPGVDVAVKARELVNLSEAARRLGMSRSTVKNWANRDGLLQPVGLSPDGTALYDLASARAVAAERSTRRATG